MLRIVLVVLLILLLIGAFPAPYNAGWHSYGYAPSGIIGLVLLIVLIMVLLGHL